MELEDLVGENDFSSRGVVVLGVETDRKGAAAHDVEGVDDVVEAASDRRRKKLVARGGAVVIGAAGVEKLAAPADHLLGKWAMCLQRWHEKGPASASRVISEGLLREQSKNLFE